MGEPPQSGTYEILQDGERLTFKMAWVDGQGGAHAMEYLEVCDGTFHDYPVKAIADEICLSLKSEVLLESVARKDGKVVLSAKRELLSDSDLKVTMSGRKPDGQSYNNVSWYAKA